MRTNFVLIDYENVQPKSIAVLNQEHFKVILFVGENQNKIDFELVAATQSLGNKVQYIKINGNGPNALDFHIAFYIGELAKETPDAFFHIISRDKGFDPLIRHLKSRKIFAVRSADIYDMPLIKAANSVSGDERLDAIIENLKQRGSSKPRIEKKLASTINSLFQKKLTSEDIADLMSGLKSRGVISIDKNKISYHLS